MRFPALVAIATLVLASCQDPSPPARTHALAGGWLATDGTIFDFRGDGTFHGVDWRGREIWGNWVTLSPTRIGFQSLMHDASYRPQYAIIDGDDRNRMDYIVTGGTHFIRARRVSPEEARAATALIVEPKLHRPGKPAARTVTPP